MKDAAVYYQKNQCYKEASECYEQIEEFDLAVKMYCQEELYEEAAKAVERYLSVMCWKIILFSISNLSIIQLALYKVLMRILAGDFVLYKVKFINWQNSHWGHDNMQNILLHSQFARKLVWFS